MYGTFSIPGKGIEPIGEDSQWLFEESIGAERRPSICKANVTKVENQSSPLSPRATMPLMLNRKSTLVLGLMLAGAALVITGMFQFVGPLLAKDKPTEQANCSRNTTVHFALIQNGKVNPDHIYAKRCETLMVINNDSVTRLMAFGQHEHHVAYDGVAEKRLEPGQQMSVTLDTVGTYLIHDHYDESVAADFTVN